MAVIESPNDPKVQGEVDRSFLAQRVSQRPLEFKTRDLLGGHYRTVLTTGLTTILNAGDAILSLRWADPQRAFILQRLRAFATLTTAFGAAQETSIDLVKLTGFTAADSGGTALVLGNQGRKSALMGPSQIADLRVANATALGAGTGTAEATAIAAEVLNLGNTVGASALGVIWDHIAGHEHPLELFTLEGFRARIAFTQGATGVVRFKFVLDWAEVPLSVF